MIEIYEKIMKYVDEHINEEITIDDLSRNTRYSRRHIYKVFQEYNDMPIMEFIRRRKMYAASAEFLSERNMYDIALDYGYETPAGFYKAFKSVFGCSPTDYKNNILKGAVMNNHNIRSVEEITKEIELDASNSGLYIERAKVYMQLFQVQKAVEDCNKALELGLENRAEAYRELGRAYFYLGDGAGKAIENYTKAIELDPNVSGDYIMRGQMYQITREYTKAIDDFTRGLELDPKITALAYCSRGVCYFKTGEPDKAAAEFEKAVEMSTDLAHTYYTVGLAYHKDLLQYDKALEYYTKSIELNPKNGLTYGFRAAVYSHFEQYDNADEDYEKAVELNPKSEWAYLSNRANLYHKMKQYDKALEYYEKILSYTPISEWTYIDRAAVYRDIREYDNALEDYEKAAEINPKSKWIYRRRADLYREIKQYDKAREDYLKALEIDPEDEKVLELLASL